MKTPLVAVSRPLHSGVCETRQDAGLPVIHSAISDSGRLRTRGGQPSHRHDAVTSSSSHPTLSLSLAWPSPLPASFEWGFRREPRGRHSGSHHSGQLIACQSFAFY